INYSILFSNTVLDTSAGAFQYFPYQAIPVKFTVIGHFPSGDQKLKFLFIDIDGDSTLSAGEEILITTGPDSVDPRQRVTWGVKLATVTGSTILPTLGDRYEAKLLRPFTTGDVFTFSSTKELVNTARANGTVGGAPYVVPNPYVGAASFEPAPFGVYGRGDRRIEFRNLPQGCTIRIYTIRGDLVQTLHHDGSMGGYVAWDLRTKDNLDVAPGLYIYHVDPENYIGKFALIK
ncbi:MAG TPA: hypothetical protein VEO56_00275, partial [Bacteroidota bacterium]|nr:hypothetical protein [Bacteroidota bacterium]